MATKFVKEMTLKEQKTEICILCKGKEDRERIFGKFHTSGIKLTAHYHCLYFSSGLEQKGSDQQDVHGFLIKDILKEVKRGMGFKCHKCGTTGATVDCSNTKCKKVYHFCCDTESGMLNQYCGAFNSFCINHRPTQKVPKCFLKDLPVTCIICNEIVMAKPSNDVLWAPCCKENWFHRDCIQIQAVMSADDIMKCPICFDKKIFIKEMKRMGIYIPEEEKAFWELQPHVESFTLECFQCNHPTCICPNGRDYDEDEMDWRLMMCNSCEDKGLHIRCGNLEPGTSEWNCKDCSEVVGKSTRQNRRKLPYAGLEAPSSSAAPKRPRRSELGYLGTSRANPVNAANENDVEVVATMSPPSSCAQSLRYEPKPSCSAGGAQCSPQQVRIITQRKPHPVEKAPVYSSSSSSTPAEITTCSTAPCEAVANSTLVSPARGVNMSGSQNLPLAPAIREPLPEKVDCSTDTTALLVNNGSCQGMDGGKGPSNSEGKGAAELNQQQEGQIPANNEKEMDKNQPPSIIHNLPDLAGMDYPGLTEIGELSYQGFTIRIFKDGTFDKFFFEPIVVLDQKSVVIQSQKLFKEDVVRFSILMWAPEIRSKVLERLRLKNIQVDEDDVRVMPYDSVQLVAKPGSIHQSIKIMGEAISYKRLNEKLEFFFLCDSPSTAEDLADNLRDSPDYLVRKWQLSLECRGLVLNPSVSIDETSANNRPYSNPILFPFGCSYPVKCM